MGVAAGAEAVFENKFPREILASCNTVTDDAGGQCVLAAPWARIVLQGIGRRTAEGATGTNQFNIRYGLKPFCDPL
jgi:hypothetical protein